MTAVHNPKDELAWLVDACCFVRAPGATGTGYLIASDRVATCAHVVLGAGLGGTVRVTFPGGSTTATVEHVSDKVDAAILRLHQPALARRLRLCVQKSHDVEWSAYGFPEVAQGRGVRIKGTISLVNARDESGQAAIQLWSSQNDRPAGFSGAPVVVRGTVVGHITSMLPDPSTGQGTLDTLYACPASYIADMLREVAGAVRLNGVSELEPPGLPYNSQTYIHRQREEGRALDALRFGLPVVLVGPELFGKSATKDHLVDRWRTEVREREDDARVVTVTVDFAAFASSFNEGERPDGDALLAWIIEQCLRESLGVDRQGGVDGSDPSEGRERSPARVNVDRWLQGRLMWTQKLEAFMKALLTESGTTQFVLIMEQASALSGLPELRDGLYGQLRSWVTKVRQEPWRRLRLILEVSTTTVLFSGGREASISPFNNVPPIPIEDLDLQQAAELVQYYELDWDEGELKELMSYIGGHPYLLRLAMHGAYQEGQNARPFGDILGDAKDAQGMFEWYLSNWFWRIISTEKLVDTLRRIIARPGTSIDDLMIAEKLNAAGIIRQVQGGHQIRYGIYRAYLKRKLGSD